MGEIFKIPMQFFAEGGESGANSGTANGNINGNQDNNGSDNNADSQSNNTPDLDKLAQARADKLTAEISKKNAALQKELDNLKKEKMTAEELKQLEMSEKEKTLAEHEKALKDKENRLLAIKSIKAAGLDDGSDKALELVDFVITDDEESINNRVKAFGDLVKRFVEDKVNNTFKDNGRNPNGGNSNGNAENGNKSNSVAESLGKARAEKQKQSNEILKYYGGGK